VTGFGKTWIGADPGGEKRFSVAILHADGTCCTHTADFVDAAIDFIRSEVSEAPAGVVRSPNLHPNAIDDYILKRL
jgi:hypothetical protein